MTASSTPRAVLIALSAVVLTGPALLAEPAECRNGRADRFPCANVDLLAHLPLDQIGDGRGNDVWGWRDGSREYALMGRSTGTAFVDLTDPENPIYLGNMRTQSSSSAWRDIKVYRDHAFVVADSAGRHGIQVFDLTRLRDVSNPPVQFTPDAVYDRFFSAHNIAINEETGFAYAVGSDTCDGGLHMVDIRTPTSPQPAGCFDREGYTHDVQCVVYRGPDRAFRGREICFAANEDSATVIDVTDKSAPTLVSRNPYEGSRITHQGWLTEDHAFFLLGDEGDERRYDHNAKTYIFDTSDLTQLRLAGEHVSSKPAVDHNLYVSGNYVYQANYQRGLTILELTDPGAGVLDEVGFFDTHPETNDLEFAGAWSVYPFLPSGVVLISDIQRGLFVVRPQLSVALFGDDFESGDLSSWSRVEGAGVAAAAPGLKRSDFALEVTVDGSAAATQVIALQPARERSLQASLLLDANGVDLDGGAVEILRLVGRGNSTVASLALDQRGGKYALVLSAESGGGLQVIDETRIPRRRTVPLRIEWRQASGAGAGDGVVRLVKKRRTRISSTTLDTRAVITAVHLGLPSGSLGADGGAYLVDDVLLTR